MRYFVQAIVCSSVVSLNSPWYVKPSVVSRPAHASLAAAIKPTESGFRAGLEGLGTGTLKPLTP